MQLSRQGCRPVLEALRDENDSTEEGLATATLTLDILRRAMRWSEVIDLASHILKKKLDPTIKVVVEFEKARAEQEGGRCYTVFEAIGD